SSVDGPPDSPAPSRPRRSTPPSGSLYTARLAAGLAGHEGVPAGFQPVADSGSSAAIAGLGPVPEADPLSAPTVALVTGLRQVVVDQLSWIEFDFGFWRKGLRVDRAG